MVNTIEWTDDGVVMIDQRKLPSEVSFLTCRDYREVADAIRSMVIRGAPAIGCAAAMGVAIGAVKASDENFDKPAVRHRRALLYDYGRRDFFWNPGKWLPEDVDRPMDAQRLADVVVQICAKKGERIPRIVEEIRNHRYDGITAVEQLVPDRSRDI